METASVVAEAANFCNFENEVFFCQASSRLVTERQKKSESKFVIGNNGKRRKGSKMPVVGIVLNTHDFRGE